MCYHWTRQANNFIAPQESIPLIAPPYVGPLVSDIPRFSTLDHVYRHSS